MFVLLANFWDIVKQYSNALTLLSGLHGNVCARD
jgi:hypothetical protein